MKNIHIYFIPIILLFSCKEDTPESDHLALFPDIEVLDMQTNMDLLNPNNEGSYHHSQIRLTTYVNDDLKNISLEVKYDEGLDKYFILTKDSKLISVLGETGNPDFYLSLNDNDTDTLTLIIDSNVRTQKVLVNGEETQLEVRAITLYK